MTSITPIHEQPDVQATPESHDEWPPLEVYDLVKRWRKDGPPVLNGINLTVEAGRAVWIGGRNGVGKTTMLRILAGLIDPTSGEVRAYGLHPFRDRRAYQRRVHFLSAGNTGVYARLTVRGQIDIWARMAFVPRKERGATVERILDQFMLRELADQRSDRLSMGQRQRLKIAMTFIADPDLVLLDEPRNSLDGEGGEILKHAIRQTVERGGSVVWCSPTGEHIDMEFDERYILEQGKLHAS